MKKRVKKKGKKREKLKSFIIKDHGKTRSGAYFITFAFLFLAVGVFSFSNISYTGLAVIEGRVIFEDSRISQTAYEGFEISKKVNTNLRVNVESDTPVGVFVKKGRCDEWSEGKDVLLIFENIQNDNLELGNRKGSSSEREIYKEENICIITSAVEELRNEYSIKLTAKEI